MWKRRQLELCWIGYTRKAIHKEFEIRYEVLSITVVTFRVVNDEEGFWGLM